MVLCKPVTRGQIKDFQPGASHGVNEELHQSHYDAVHEPKKVGDLGLSGPRRGCPRWSWYPGDSGFLPSQES